MFDLNCSLHPADPVYPAYLVNTLPAPPTTAPAKSISCSSDALVNWQCTQYDNVVSLSSFGNVLGTVCVDAANGQTKSRTDGAGKLLGSSGNRFTPPFGIRLQYRAGWVGAVLPIGLVVRKNKDGLHKVVLSTHLPRATMTTTDIFTGLNSVLRFVDEPMRPVITE